MKKISTLLLVLVALLAPMTANAEEVTFDFENNPQGWPVGEGANFADGNLTNPLVVDGVSLTNVQGDAKQPARLMKDNSGVTALYVYKDGSIKFNAPDSKALTKIVVTMKSNSLDLTSSTGAVADNVWTGNATEVLFTAAANRQMLKMVVTIADENAETVKPAAADYDVEAANIAAFNAIEDGKKVKLMLTNAKVNGVKSDDYYVEDASGATVFKGLNLTAGTALNGYVIGTKSTDGSVDMNEVFVEYALTATDASTFEATTTVLNGTVMTGAEAAVQANYGRLITLENVAISGGGQNKKLTVDGVELPIKARDYMGVLPADFTWPENASKITGVLIYYYGWVLMPISADAIVAAGTQSVAEFDFLNNNMELPIGNADNINAGNLGGKSITLGDVTLSFVNSMTMPTRYYFNAKKNQLQLIAGGQIRFTAAEGKAIAKIEITPVAATNNKWDVDGEVGTLSEDKLVWEGNTTTVRFTANGALYLTKIVVTAVTKNDATITPADTDTYTEITSLAKFNDASDNSLVKLVLTDAVITSGMVNGWGCYVQDANGGAHFYCTTLDFEVGDVLNGVVYGKKSNQNMGARICMTEKTNAQSLTITKNGIVTPVEGAIAEINIAANKCRMVKLSGVSVRGTKETEATITDAAGNTITINNGKTNYYPYVIKESLENIAYRNATVTGILIGRSATENQLLPFSITGESVEDINQYLNCIIDWNGSQSSVTAPWGSSYARGVKATIYNNSDVDIVVSQVVAFINTTSLGVVHDVKDVQLSAHNNTTINFNLTDSSSMPSTLPWLNIYYKIGDLDFIKDSREEGMTGISRINATDGNLTIYNLQGVRMNGLKKGLNIVNGKKIVIK